MKKLIKIGKKRIKKIILIASSIVLLAAFLCALRPTFSEKTTSSIWDGTIAESFSNGDGSIDNPYVIKEADELALLFSKINSDESADYYNKFYVLDNNMNLNGFDFSYSQFGKTFSGVIDGAGYTISNFTLNNCTATEDLCTYSLFYDLNSATIKNLNIKNIEIKNNNSMNESVALINSSTSSTITNLSIEDVTYDLNVADDYEMTSSGLLLNDLGSNTISNINIAITSSIETNVLIKKYLNSDIYNIAYLNSGEELGVVGDSLYGYRYENDKIVFDNNYPTKTILESLNRDSEYTWVYEYGSFRIQNKGENAARPQMKLMAINPGTNAITPQNSGVSGTTLYVNDFQMDTDYYSGLNYTTSTNNAYPTTSDKEVYSANNLVRVQATYSGSDYSKAMGGTGYTGVVSPEENIDTLVYYKVYPINNNGTTSTSDDYVEFELIDHPFVKRPDDMAFNGWVTDNRNATITLDSDIYVRSVKIPVTYSGGKPSDIVINFYATWIKATTYTVTANTAWNTILGGLDSAGMLRMPTMPSVSTLYEKGHIDRNRNYPNQTYRLRSGNYYRRVTNTTTSCNTNGGCDYYYLTSDRTYNYSKTYYTIDTSNGADYAIFTQLSPSNYMSNDSSIAGLYRKVTIPRNNSYAGYYDANGNLQTSGTCNTRDGCTYYEFINLVDSAGIFETMTSGTEYYKLVTRDTNIVFLNYNNYSNALGSTTQTKPFTFTSYNNGSDRRNNAYLYVTTFYANKDLRLEWMRVNGRTSIQGNGTTPSTSYAIFGQFNNLKIGRGVIRYNTSNQVFGSVISGGAGTGSSSSSTKYRVIVESGFYNNTASVGTTGTYYVEGTTIYGNDIDRVLGNNANLDVRFVSASVWGGNLHSSNSDRAISSNVIVKSGTFGSNRYDYTTGMYVGGRNSGTIYAPVSLSVEGGSIYNISGGPLVDSGVTTTNIVYVYIKGGTVDAIFGGAGTTETYGNRIIQLTGGTINYSVCGGSNGISASGSDGRLTGSTYIYAGGHIIVGSSNLVTNNTKETNSEIEAGSIFGAGNGNDDSTSVGSVYNSRIVIDEGATIRRNVYGGGNYGATGSQNDRNNTTSNTEIVINGGAVTGSVYGGGNQNGSGADDLTYTSGRTTTHYNVNSNISITINDGTIGKIYGGSNINGTVYGSATINVNGGTVTEVYGGGEGSNTYLRDNIDIVIGKTDVTGKPIINTAVYGGSAYGTVNATTKNAAADSSKHVNVTVNNGNITGSVFGGAKGDSSNTPYIKGNITVKVNGGTISNVFGGFDAAGTPQGTVYVYLNGGTIGDAFGGGNNTSINTTNIYLQGSTVTNLYGGSNQSGTATTTNVITTSGTATNVYGGNNAGGQAITSNVTINGANITSAYGGNNAGGTNPNSYITVNSGTVPNVFGGGNQAPTTTSHALINGGNVTNTFGGGNLATVTTSNVTLNGGTIENTYGGGNQAGATTTNITVPTTSTVVNTNIYGGSNQSGNVTATNITASGGTLTNIYGGNNQGGLSSTTNVTTNGGLITNVYGGGNLAQVSTTNVVINGSTIENVYGGGNQAQVNGNTSLKIFGGTITGNIFGGGNYGTTSGNTNVIINNGTINGSAYGGGNGATATVLGNTNITVGGNTVIGTSDCTVKSQCSLFGGGNAAFTGTEENDNSSSNVRIAGATIYGNVYGGANTSVINGTATVTVGNNVAPTTEITRGNILINGTVFGGGEANASGSEIYDWHFIGVTDAIIVDIDGLNYTNFDILGSIFGSGNASTTSGTSNIFIKNYGTFESPKRNISIQRTDLLVIDNSALVLEGATDRTNEYSDVLFTLSIIKELDLKNNSTLFLETGANELRSYKSLTSNGDVAEVSINPENKTITRNVDNRIYMIGSGNKVLNIANERLTTYGDVTGMTFFGLYKYGANDTINVGMYGDYDFGEELGWGANIFTTGSYVLGSHKLNHDITIDGFYSNFLDEEGVNSIDYINPTPEDSPMYMWIVGEYVQSYDVNLQASKYSTLGAVELPLIDYNDPNTTFEIMGVDFSALDRNVQLVDKNSIPKIASNAEAADNVMGISMEPSISGWLSTGTTSFYNNTSIPIQGLKNYVGENSTQAKSLLFYLYHSKNISTSGNAGTVQIIIRAITRIDDLTNEAETLIINVNISRALYATNDYEASLTTGRKYELFTSTLTKITSKSSISAYYSLYAPGENVYRDGYHRALVSNIALPENTKITMLDLSQNQVKYYYHVITASDVVNAQNQINFDGEADYDLSMFEIMGAFNSGVHYDDSTMNSLYYNSVENYSQEEFIFIIDFEDTNFQSNSLDNYLLFELQNNSNETMVSVLGIEEANMHYDIYKNLDAVIDLEGTISNDTIYSGEDVTLNLQTSYTQSQVLGNTIYDTHLFDEKMGLKITLFNSDNEIVTGTSLLGLTYEINGIDYSPNIDGTTRIKIADRVGNAQTWIKVKTGTSNIATGNYRLRVESFGSSDGIYYGLNTSDYIDFNIYIINEIYGLNINTTNNEMIIDKTTGYTLNKSNEVKYNIEYNSGLNNPSIRIKLLRRKYDEIYSTEYEDVDISNYVLNNLIASPNLNEYLIVRDPSIETNLTLRMGTNLIPGTYMIEFMLYDNNSLIGTVERYLIIK